MRYGTPYKLVAGTRFYERREVKDVIAYLRLILNPDDSISLLRVINTTVRGIGQKTVSELTKWARSMGLSEFRALQTLIAGTPTSQPPPFTTRTIKQK